MVVKRYLEPILESVFHKDSYGYRPGKSAHDALVVARRRCWDHDWVLDLDIKSFFDEIDWGLLMLAVCRHTDCKWVLLYLKRWLEAPVSMPDGTLVSRDRGTPQGAVVSPVLANLFLHYAFDCWMRREYPDIPFERYADDAICHCQSEAEALELRQALEKGLRNASYNCTRRRPRLFTARTPIGRGNIPSDRSTFLGTHFVQERLSIARANASSHSFQRSVRRPPRKCGAVCGAGDCIAVTIWNWKQSPAGFARSLQAGCATMAGFTPRSFRRSCAR
jgi:RNA-directed DNA polymerase